MQGIRCLLWPGRCHFFFTLRYLGSLNDIVFLVGRNFWIKEFYYSSRI